MKGKQKILCASLLEAHQYLPPLGAAYINGSLLAHGYNSDVLVEFIKTTKPERELVIDRERAPLTTESLSVCVDHIKSYQPTVICYSIYNYNRESTLLLASHIRDLFPKIKQVLGGPEVKDLLMSDNFIETLDKSFDFLVKGEGEEVIIKIMEALDNNSDEAIYGVNKPPYKSSNYYIDKFDFKTQVQDMNVLKIPDFGSNPRFERYLNSDNWWAGIPINTSRGCSGNCHFCNVKTYSKAVRFRSGEHIMNEVIYQTKKYKTNRFMIVDDDPLSLVAREETDKFLNMLKNSPIRYDWNLFNAKLDRSLSDESRIKLLSDAGLGSVVFGFESASENTRKHMNKFFPVKESIRILENFKKYNIKVNINVIYCYPSETEEDFQETLDFIKNHGHLIQHIGTNIFFNNPVYVDRFPDSIRLIEPTPEEPLASWENDIINQDVMWDRYHRISEVLAKNFKGSYCVASPEGSYEDKVTTSM